MQLLIEAVAVGAMLAIALLLVHLVFGPLKTVTAVLVTGFLVGMAIHILCEVSRINLWYCSHGRACRN
jgi:hypothetical protein